MSRHPWYSHDEDDDFDCTYARIYFKVPEAQVGTMVALMDRGHDPAAAWQKFFEAMR